MSTTDNHTTAGLEPALRYLVKHPGVKVSTVEAKFNLQPKALWAWFARYNGNKKEVSAHRIDAALAVEAAGPKPKKVPSAVGERINRAIAAPKSSLTKQPTAAKLVVLRPPALTSNIVKWLGTQNAPVVAMLNSYQVKVTPELAASWLLLNQGNRTPSRAKIQRFAAAIKAGKWFLNGETVKFSVSGRLLDGQSRLEAIVKAGVPAVLEIRAGLPDDAQKSMDIGETRKGTHTLEMMGEKYPIILSPALRWIFRWENDSLSSRGKSKTDNVSVLENMEIEPMLKRHEGLRASVGWCVSAGHKVADMMPASEAAFFHYLLGQASTAKRDTFFAALATGLGLTEKSPAYHLRERLLSDRASTKRMGVRERMALTIKAWNAHYNGEHMALLQFVQSGARNEAFPVIAGVTTPAKAA